MRNKNLGETVWAQIEGENMNSLRIAISALCIAALPMAALAEKGGNGKNNGNRGQAAQSDRGNSGNGRSGALHAGNGNSANARANPSTGFCPIGLRKRETGCVPPGEAANGTTAAEWAEQQGYRYVAGATLDPSEYTLLANYTDYDLPELPAGETYAVINRTAVVIDPETNTLLRVATR